jgi:hypothetical protein
MGIAEYRGRLLHAELTGNLENCGCKLKAHVPGWRHRKQTIRTETKYCMPSPESDVTPFFMITLKSSLKTRHGHASAAQAGNGGDARGTHQSQAAGEVWWEFEYGLITLFTESGDPELGVVRFQPESGGGGTVCLVCGGFGCKPQCIERCEVRARRLRTRCTRYVLYLLFQEVVHVGVGVCCCG